MNILTLFFIEKSHIKSADLCKKGNFFLLGEIGELLKEIFYKN